MWMECISDRAYRHARGPRHRHRARAARGARTSCWPPARRSCSSTSPCSPRSSCTGGEERPHASCAAPWASGASPPTELAFARELHRPRSWPACRRERLALHICRGNWTPDERVALAGDYRPLLPLLRAARRSARSSSSCARRAPASSTSSRDLPDDRRIGVGVVNQKHAARRDRRGDRRRGPSGPSSCSAPSACCSIRTAASPPSPTTRSSGPIAEAKLGVLAEARNRLRARYG